MAELQRDLGLSAVFTVSLGAMIGSGIFVLPGLATELAGPGAALDYFLAGLIVIPAVLSQSHLATTKRSPTASSMSFAASSSAAPTSTPLPSIRSSPTVSPGCWRRRDWCLSHTRA